MNSYKHFIEKKGVKMLAFTVIVFTSLSIALLVFLLFMSPGKPHTYRDEKGNLMDGSISEKIFTSIGGVKQGMFIRSKNTSNPVLLYVHGGPGFPNYFLIEKFDPGLEDLFTVCFWEQRGGGLSFSREVSLESMNIEQLTCDAIEVTNYLRERFGKKKIYILAHSGGTTIALNAVSKAPELYSAYIAMAQITRQPESERIAYRYILNEFIKKNDKAGVRKLRKFHDLESDSDVKSFFNSGIRDKAMHELGIGTMRTMRSVYRDIFIPTWTCRAYTLKEKIKIWGSKFFFLPKTKLRAETLVTDFADKFSKIDVPVYFMSVKYDLTVNVDLCREYYKRVIAPVKGFYSFENSAHSPLFEEHEKFMEILKRDVLNLHTQMSD